MTRRKPRKPRASRGGPGPGLDGVRERITALDRRLVDLLNRRARLVVRVGALKRAAGTGAYAPDREAQVLDGVLARNAGPLPDRAVEAVMREVMSASIALQRPMRVGYLGPPGSYSHVAASRHFGSSVEFENLREIHGVFTEVARGHVDHGLVPIENSTGGGIVETMDAFRDLRRHGPGAQPSLHVVAEVQLAVRHALLADCAPAQVRRIFSKPEVFQQCRRWLSTQYPGAELIPTPSSSRAAEIVAAESRAALAEGRATDGAAIASALAGHLHGIRVLFPHIEDNADNITRFHVLGRTQARRSGDDKTSIMFETPDRPGALVQVLRQFENANINLTNIERRPGGRRNWTHVFFVDCRGHLEDAAVARALRGAEKHCRELHVLGSYPRSKRVVS